MAASASAKLESYNRKRDFAKTPEPKGTTARGKEDYSFVIQKHAARRLHYDFRLELGGVLLSWAVAKGPSYNPDDKRLAVRTENHPLSYGGFEGIIPQGEYGGGTVMLWDKGTWEPDADPRRGLRKGHLSFTLNGERMHGRWTLVRMKGKEREKRENWLLIKDDDVAAHFGKEAQDFLRREATSIETGRTMDEIAANKKDGSQSLSKLQETYNKVQLATLVDEPPAGENWLHEIKFDGYRLLGMVSGGHTVLKTRNGHDWTAKFPHIVRALRAMPVHDGVFDMEAVVLNKDGRTDFQALQNTLSGDKPARIEAYLLDCLYLNGEDLRKESLLDRKERLQSCFDINRQDIAALHYSDHVIGQGKRMIVQACHMGLEGIVSKKTTSTYQGDRQKTWVKSKCVKRQEFVIIGFTMSKSGGHAVGSLHLGYHKDGDMVYAGKVGTGFNDEMAADLYKRLKPDERKTPPVKGIPVPARKASHWVEPKMLCEVAFGEWTGSGRIRHSSFQGLREDKSPRDVVREKPQAVGNVTKRKASRQKGNFDIAGVTITHPGRVVFPDTGMTKGELAAYYGAVAPLVLDDLSGHPVSLMRCPGGIDGECFFQRSPGEGWGEDIESFTWKHKGKTHDYLYTKTEKGLIQLVQMGVIEFHPWGAAADDIDRPDRLVFDLDPDEEIPFAAVRLAAWDMRHRLENLGLESFVKCTGGKGLHIVAPLTRRQGWEETKNFARGLAERMARDVPEAYTATMSKAKRKGKIFIDYFRNDYTATSIADYAVRARKGAPVTVPLAWDELDDLQAASQWTTNAVLKRIKQKKHFRRPACKQSLTKAMIKEMAGI